MSNICKVEVIKDSEDSEDSEDSIESTYDIKKKELDDYINSLKKAPAQKSKEWYAIKQLTIGGSEIATVLGVNPYKKVKELIAEKIGIGYKFEGNAATRWGNLFEYITKKWGEIILKMQDSIKETGSIEGVIERQRYSPDGLGVVKLVCEDGTYEYFFVLFEFKAPLRTLPSKSIPKHYIPQIQTGLLNIPIADLGIFINNCYRKCKLSDLQFNSSYDVNYHDGDAKKLKYGMTKVDPYACGVICFYQTLEDYHKLYDHLGYGSDSDDDINNTDNTNNVLDSFNSLYAVEHNKYDKNSSLENRYYVDGDIELLLNTRDDPIDLGEASGYLLDRVLELYDNKRLSVIYYPIIVNSRVVNDMKFVKTHNLERTEKKIDPNRLANIYINRFIDKCKNDDLSTVGYLPWKLMRSDIIIEEKDEKWLDKIETPVNETLTIMDKILKSKDPAQEYNNIYKVYDDDNVDDKIDICDELESMKVLTRKKSKKIIVDGLEIELDQDEVVENMCIV